MGKNFIRHNNRIKGFVMIANEVVFDERLSERALVLYLKIIALSANPNWEFNTSGLSTVTGWHRETVLKYLNELEESGYLIRTQPRSGGKFGKTKWHIFESPVYINKSGQVIGLETNLPDALDDSDQIFIDLAREAVISKVTKGFHRSRGARTPVRPTTGCTDSGAPDTILNNINKRENQIKNNINSQCYALGDFATQTVLDNETGGMGEVVTESMPDVSTIPPVPTQSQTASDEPDRVIKQLKKKYKSAFVDFALELSKDKDDQFAYAKTLLRDWKKQQLQSIEEVKRHVDTFEDDRTPDLTLRPYSGSVRRVEMKPSWLDEEQQHYNADREYTEEQLETIERMKQMQSFITNIDDIESQLPF